MTPLTGGGAVAPYSIHVGGVWSPDHSVYIQCDLPPGVRMRNAVGCDRLGLCVFTSVAHMLMWQNDPELQDLQQWMKNKPGGGDPKKLAAMVAQKCREDGVDPAEHELLQYEGTDPTLIQHCLATQRMVCVSYCGYDPHYFQHIDHMVNVVCWTDRWVCILDNNFPGDDDLVWMSPAEFQVRWAYMGQPGQRRGWVVASTRPAPPPTMRRNNVRVDACRGSGGPGR